MWKCEDKGSSSSGNESVFPSKAFLSPLSDTFKSSHKDVSWQEAQVTEFLLCNHTWILALVPPVCLDVWEMFLHRWKEPPAVKNMTSIILRWRILDQPPSGEKGSHWLKNSHQAKQTSGLMKPVGHVGFKGGCSLVSQLKHIIPAGEPGGCYSRSLMERNHLCFHHLSCSAGICCCHSAATQVW